MQKRAKHEGRLEELKSCGWREVRANVRCDRELLKEESCFTRFESAEASTAVTRDVSF